MEKQSTTHKKLIVVSCLSVLFFTTSLVLFIHGGYLQKLFSKFTPSNQIEFKSSYNDKTIDAWDNCLSQLHPDADIVFFGDSITRRGSFDKYYPDKIVCNLGLGSDNILGMIERVEMIKTVSPDKVFIMGGINSLRNNTLDQSVAEYDTLLKSVSEKCTGDIFVLSVLPIARNNSESLGCSPKTISTFNNAIKQLAEDCGFSYIDLHNMFVAQDGYIKPELTTDGVHLTDEAYGIWINAISNFIN